MKNVYNYLFNSQTNLLWMTYWMYILVIPALIGFVVNALKSRQFKPIYLDEKNSAVKTDVGFIASHHQWLIRRFSIFVVLSMFAVGTVYVGVGYVVAVAAIVWWFASLVRGMYALTVRKPMPGLHYSR